MCITCVYMFRSIQTNGVHNSPLPTTNNCHTYKNNKRWFDLFDDESTIWTRLDYLQERHWIDRNTKIVSAELLVYNGQVEPLISKSVISFDFTRG